MEYNCVLDADVVIAGAGTAGSAAAIAAADQGLNVLVIEQFGAPGGSGTLSLVTPMMHTSIPGNPMCSYVSREINRRMVSLGAATGAGDSWFDPEMLKFVLEEMLAERRVRALYHTMITGVVMEKNKLVGIEACSKSGRTLFHAPVFIDATGDADIVKLAGLPFMHGDEATGANQPMSLRYTVGGVDLDAFYMALCEAKGESAPYAARPENFDGAVTTGSGKTWPLSRLFAHAVECGMLAQEDAVYWQFFTIPGRAGEIAFNCPEFFDIHDADDALNLSRVQVEGKRAILRQIRFYRESLPGFAHCYLSSVAVMVGVRESRRAITDHVITAEELLSHTKFPDAILRSNYPVDVHGRKLKCEQIDTNNDDDKPYYEVPMRALIVRDAENLMVAGRCLGAEFIAQSAVRIMPSCRAMGEACGIAAAMVARGENLHALNGASISAEMIRRGADFVGIVNA